MVVASPCALVISIPAALLSALASAARGGVLFKGGRYLEAAAQVRVVAFDKTGTLTTGRPGVVAVIPVDGAPVSLKETCIDTDAPEHPAQPIPDDQIGPLSPEQRWLLALAAAIERPSEHPLARAIVRGADERGLPVIEASGFEALTGAGATATIQGQRLTIGRPMLFDLSPDLMEQIAAQQELGRTVVALGSGRTVWGIIAIADTVRPEAAAAVARLKRTGIERVVLLTGDNHQVAQAIGQALGVDEVYAELLPEQKVAVLRELEQRYGPVAMIGDGVNDAPALASATLGVAMGAAGTDVALESADMLLMSDDLSRLPGALRLARRARAIVRQNLAFAFAVIAVLMVFAMFGAIPLTLGVIGHEGSTLIVVANGLRLLAERIQHG